MLISPAYAQVGGAGGFDLMALAPLVLIFVVFYFLLIRPQQKRMKEHKAMLSKVQRNDRIVTNGGLVGKVAKVHDERDELEVDIADNVRVTVRRSMISEVMSKSDS
ncbi:MAG: preprotein translocase subunit YajC [Alphaproteobacteria bacterium]|jgi:preprotein translocase subunit YajC|nr:preprotein translocase subunit YajC [Alphaproteobacteria bacterium]